MEFRRHAFLGRLEQDLEGVADRLAAGFRRGDLLGGDEVRLAIEENFQENARS